MRSLPCASCGQLVFIWTRVCLRCDHALGFASETLEGIACGPTTAPLNHRQVPDDRYITTARGRDYADVTPLKGVVFSSSAHPELSVAVDVIRVPT